MKRRQALALIAVSILPGCANPAVRSQSPEESDLLTSQTKLIGDIAVPFGMTPITIEDVGLVTNLAGTGSDPDPSPERAMLVHEMQINGVKNADLILASNMTSLVRVRGVLRPGIQKGDKFDLEVRVPTQSGTTSLRNGWLMPTRLKEQAVLNNQLREGQTLGMGQGAVMVDPSAEIETDKVVLGRGRILGGGVALKSRPLGLVLKPESQSVRHAAQIESAVNKRFHTFEKGIKKGVATAHTDQWIEMDVHARYKDNVPRFMQVVRALPLRETPQEKVTRIGLLEIQLLDRLASSSAALRLEALGRDGVDPLKKGIVSTDPEVRFYAAEALAYLDESDAAAPLAELAKQEPAFRVFALTALSAMDDLAAYEALRGLLDVPSAETRYGAFRALWAMNSQDQLVRGENLGDQFSYHVIDTTGPEMVHVTRSYRAEIVLFGRDQKLEPPFSLDAGKQIMVNAASDGRVTVSKFALNQPDQKRVISPRLDEIVRTIIELGGTYPDVVQMLQQAKSKSALPSKFEIDALPTADRRFIRDRGLIDPSGEGAEEEDGGFVVSNPAPDLFGRRPSKPEAKTVDGEASTSDSGSSTDEEPQKEGFWSKIFARMGGNDEK